VIADGRSGLLVEPADPGSLARAIAHLLRDAEERARLGAAGRRTVRERYDVADRVKDLAALYREVLAPR
jgi:glycosyltransferase involved in cell wall biosynthesis